MLGQDALDRVAMHAELARNRADLPMLGVVEPQDLRFEFRRDHSPHPSARHAATRTSTHDRQQESVAQERVRCAAADATGEIARVFRRQGDRGLVIGAAGSALRRIEK